MRELPMPNTTAQCIVTDDDMLANLSDGQKVFWQGRMLAAAGPDFPDISQAFPAAEGLLHEPQCLDGQFPEAIACEGQGDVDPPSWGS